MIGQKWGIETQSKLDTEAKTHTFETKEKLRIEQDLRNLNRVKEI